MTHAVLTKIGVLTVFGAIGGFISTMFGGWDSALTTLIIFMAIDFVTGLMVAGVFHRSGKSESGALESKAGWKGLCRKGASLLVVLVAVRLDIALGSSFIKDAVVIGYIVNESISIIENVGLMGLPLPAVIMKAIEVLQKKATEEKGA